MRTETWFFVFLKTYVLVTQKNHLHETVLLSTQKHVLLIDKKKSHLHAHEVVLFWIYESTLRTQVKLSCLVWVLEVLWSNVLLHVLMMCCQNTFYKMGKYDTWIHLVSTYIQVLTDKEYSCFGILYLLIMNCDPFI